MKCPVRSHVRTAVFGSTASKQEGNLSSKAVRALGNRGLVVVPLLAVVTALLAWASLANANTPATFKAGAASADIAPKTPQYIGGYGYLTGPTTEVFRSEELGVTDDLQARAFIVAKGKTIAVFVVTDLTGWFAAYEGSALEPYGVDRTREKIAAQLRNRGYDITRENVIISTTHTHGGPAVTGIWGTTDPDYLKQVSDAAVTATLEAESKGRTSEIWSAVGNVRSFVWQNGQGTNHPDGFGVDENLPIMWARDPKTGATNGLYANVPNHPDQFQARRYQTPIFSSDWPGYARRALDELNGGTSVIAAGTLGRQEPPGSNPLYEEVIPQGQYVANEIQRTMAKARPLTDGRIGGSETPIRFVADNAALTGLIRSFQPGNPLSIPDNCFGAQCSIPRSTAEPYWYQQGNTIEVGTSVTTVRVGDLVYWTNPGEAFPEVNEAIAESIEGAQHGNPIGLAGDFLGYYWVRGQYTTTGTGNQFGSSNFVQYNTGANIPFENVAGALEGARELGFGTNEQPIQAVHDATVVDRPGIQWYPNRLQSDDPVISFYGSVARSQNTLVQPSGEIQWDFGDGSTRTTVNNTRFDHTFPGPGSYEVTATITGTNGKTRSWTDTVTIDPPLTVEASVTKRSTAGAALSLDSTGGSGELVGARWTCQDGTAVTGLTPTCKSDSGGTVTVTAADGAGNTATATVEIAPQARAALRKVAPAKPVIKKGKSGKVTVTVGNGGQAKAEGVKICLKPSSKDRKGFKVKPTCKSVGSLAVGASKAAKFAVKASKNARAKGQIQVTVSSGNAGSTSRNLVVKTKK